MPLTPPSSSTPQVKPSPKTEPGAPSESTRAALAAFVTYFARFPTRGQFGERQDAARSVIQICRSPRLTGSFLGSLLASPSPEVRANAAFTFGFLEDFLSHRVEQNSSGRYHAPLSDHQLQQGFWSQVPRLAERAANDSNPQVRFNALVALERLTYRSPQAPWEKTFAPLARALRSPQFAERRQAAQVLAKCPVSPWAVLGPLRRGLYDTDLRVRVSSKTAIYHIALLQRNALTNHFLSELQKGGSPALAAARDLQSLASTLWYGVYRRYDESVPPIEETWVWEARDPARPAALQRRRDRPVPSEPGNERLVIGIRNAFKQNDIALHRTLAEVLLVIAEGTEGLLGHGGAFTIAERRLPTLLSALDVAAHTLNGRAPDSTSRLRAASVALHKPHNRF